MRMDCKLFDVYEEDNRQWFDKKVGVCPNGHY
jgi:hypothetical protein